jgi:hypothetical protein
VTGHTARIRWRGDTSPSVLQPWLHFYISLAQRECTCSCSCSCVRVRMRVRVRVRLCDCVSEHLQGWMASFPQMGWRPLPTRSKAFVRSLCIRQCLRDSLRRRARAHAERAGQKVCDQAQVTCPAPQAVLHVSQPGVQAHAAHVRGWAARAASWQKERGRSAGLSYTLPLALPVTGRQSWVSK